MIIIRILLQVDGMDAFAVKQACKFAKEHALKNGPIVSSQSFYLAFMTDYYPYKETASHSYWSQLKTVVESYAVKYISYMHVSLRKLSVVFDVLIFFAFFSCYY